MRYFSYFILLLCFIGCKPTQTQLPDDAVMEQLLIENPDSVATLIESQKNISTLSQDEKMNNAWWLARAHFLRGRSLINDTLIYEVLEYYKKKESPRVVMANVLAAEQVDALGDKLREKAKFYEEALRTGEIYNNHDYDLHIARQLHELYEMPQDEARINNLISVVKKNGGKEWSLETYYNLLVIYTYFNQPDSVIKYGKEGMELAYIQERGWVPALTRMYVEGLNSVGKHNEALKNLRILEKEVKTGPEVKLNYISTWIGLNKLDSAKYYIESYKPIMEQNKGHYEIDIFEMILNAYTLIIDSKEGRNVDLRVIGVSGDNLLKKTRKRIKADREQRYMQSKLIEDNLKLDVEQAEMKQRFLWIGMLVLIVIMVVIFVYQRKLLKKERTIQQAKEQLRLRSMQLSENEQTIHKNDELIKTLSGQLDENNDLKEEIDQLTESTKAIQQENDALQEDINNYLRVIDKKDEEVMVYSKLVQENERLAERENFLVSQLVNYTKPLANIINKPHYIDVMQWPEIQHAINQLFDGFSYRLHTDFPGLNEEDIKYCCLVKLRLSNSLIATLTGISPSSVAKRKQRIKEKMSQQRRPSEINKEQSLEIYLWNY